MLPAQNCQEWAHSAHYLHDPEQDPATGGWHEQHPATYMTNTNNWFHKVSVHHTKVMTSTATATKSKHGNIHAASTSKAQWFKEVR